MQSKVRADTRPTMNLMRRSSFARSGHSNPFGKLGPNLGSLRLGFKTEDRLRVEASKVGMPLMEWVRQELELRLHGREVVEREITVRLDAIQGRKSTETESK